MTLEDRLKLEFESTPVENVRLRHLLMDAWLYVNRSNVALNQIVKVIRACQERKDEATTRQAAEGAEAQDSEPAA